MVNEVKNSTKPKCNNIKRAILIVASFLSVALIFSSSYTFNAFGDIKRSSIDCIPEGPSGSNIVDCCYQETDTDTGESVGIYCATCYDDGNGNLSCGAYEKVESIKPPKVCPDGSSPDANGICPPITQGPKEPPAGADCTANPNDPLCQTAGINPPTDDNKPSKPKLPKDDILGLQPTERKGKQSSS
jgi:hypothetical protein